MDAIRRFCMYGVNSTCAGLYFTTNTPSNRAAFINLQPLIGIYTSNELKLLRDGEELSTQQFVSVRHRVLKEAFKLATAGISATLEMVVCSPSVHMFVVLDTVVEVAEFICKPTQKTERSGITRMLLNWHECDTFARVYTIADGADGTGVGSLCRSSVPTVISQAWMDEMRAMIDDVSVANAEQPHNVNLGASEWSASWAWAILFLLRCSDQL